MMLSMIWPFGTMMRLLAPVLSTVVSICTSSTASETPAPSIPNFGSQPLLETLFANYFK